MVEQKKEEDQLGYGIAHESARPMQVMLDKNGVMWLCDKDVDPNKPFDKQNCWTCDNVLFTRGG